MRWSGGGGGWGGRKGSTRGGIQRRPKIRGVPCPLPETGWGLQASACSSKSDRMGPARHAEPTLTTTKEQLWSLPVVGPSMQLWAGLPSAGQAPAQLGRIYICNEATQLHYWMSAARVICGHRDGPTKIQGSLDKPASRKTKVEMGVRGRTGERGGQGNGKERPSHKYACLGSLCFKLNINA